MFINCGYNLIYKCIFNITCVGSIVSCAYHEHLSKNYGHIKQLKSIFCIVLLKCNWNTAQMLILVKHSKSNKSNLKYFFNIFSIV